MLQIYNTLSRSKQELKPIHPGKISMYVCGITVYDYCHMGHARMCVAFDVVYRYLKASGYDVTYVQNITDIDDKIISRAQEQGIAVPELTAHYIKEMHTDFDALGILRPDHQPLATNSVPGMLLMIEQLIELGHAYAVPGGDVYYAVNSFKGYGKLSGKKLGDLRAGERVAVDNDKRDAMDFVLWKAAKPGEPSWESPWGAGRPGWHIECSAMSRELLGDHFDIHGGGQDLVFPHHENERAQSEACQHGKFANYWLHNGFINVDDEKMSKSLGNFFTIREVLKLYPAEALRLFLISSQYRSPINYTTAQLDEAKTNLTRLYTSLRGLEGGSAPADSDYEKRFRKAMDDDFNTRDALAALFELSTAINKTRGVNESGARDLAALLQKLADILGLLQDKAETFLTAGGSSDISDQGINELISARKQARADKNFARADEIRHELDSHGIILEDSAEGTQWRRG